MALAGRGRKRRCAFDSRHGYGVELRLTARLVNLLSDKSAVGSSCHGDVEPRHRAGNADEALSVYRGYKDMDECGTGYHGTSPAPGSPAS